MVFSTPSKALLSLCFWVSSIKATDTNLLMDAEFLQQTTCLLPANSLDAYPLDRLPSWVNAPKLVRVKDHFGRENIVVSFLTVSGWAYGSQNTYDAGDWYNEMCVSFLSDVTDDFFGRVWPRSTKRRRNQQKFLQQARCLGGLKEGGNLTNTPLVQRAKVKVLLGGRRGGMVEWEQQRRGKGAVVEKLPVSGSDIERMLVSVDDEVLLEQRLMHEIPETTKHMLVREKMGLELDLLMARTMRVEGSNVTSGAAVRFFTTEPTSLKTRPVRVNLSPSGRLMEKFFPETPSFEIAGANLHQCVSLDRMRPAEPDVASKRLRMFGRVNPNETAVSFFQQFSGAQSSTMDTTDDANIFGDSETGPPGTLTDLFDEIVWEVMQFPAAGVEHVYHSRFRWFLAVLDALYPFYAMVQQRVAGKYPSERFRETRAHLVLMLFHILFGSAVLYIGCYIHIDNVVKEVYEWDDINVPWRRPLYYAFGVCGALQAITVWCVTSKVMGEKRITLPLYFSAGVVNMINSILIFISPTLENAFRLWGSMNVFIMVRFLFVTMIPLAIDWELLYTYVILAASSMVYPVTKQSEYVFFFLVVAPIVYGPIHEYSAKLFAYDVDDELGENRIAAKNIKGYRACSCLWKKRHRKLVRKWSTPSLQRRASLSKIGHMVTKVLATDHKLKLQRRRAFFYAFMRMKHVHDNKVASDANDGAKTNTDEDIVATPSVEKPHLEEVVMDLQENNGSVGDQKVQRNNFM